LAAAREGGGEGAKRDNRAAQAPARDVGVGGKGGGKSGGWFRPVFREKKKKKKAGKKARKLRFKNVGKGGPR